MDIEKDLLKRDEGYKQYIKDLHREQFIEWIKYVSYQIKESEINLDILDYEQTISKEYIFRKIDKLDKDVDEIKYSFYQDLENLKKDYNDLNEKIQILFASQKNKGISSYYKKIKKYIKDLLVRHNN
ncbi:hypothetical protein [Alkalithermobacter thermoalcaliphilus]|uniref:hypothetical protein n=1 Tax=Clostridium paradoxum TaxID=29346 RepID=UPI000825A0DD